MNTLLHWRKKWEPTKRDFGRAEVLEGVGNPVAAEQRALIERKREIMALIDKWIAEEAAARERP